MNETKIRKPYGIYSQADVAHLVRWLKANDITKGRRTVKAIIALRKERAEARERAPQPLPPAARVKAARTERFTQEIQRRGGETAILGKDQRWDVEIMSQDKGMYLLHAEGWRHYSNRVGAWHATLSYLCGQDDNGLWAVRVPGTITTVTEALAWVTPPEVKRAAGGYKRQGDVYLVRVGKRCTPSPSGRYGRSQSHVWDAETRTLRHEPRDGKRHRTVKVGTSWPCVKVVEQRALDAARGGAGD